MQKKIIHIGLHKTGTSFLQKNYFPTLKGVSYWTSRNFFNKISTSKEMNGNLLLSGEALSGLPWSREWIIGIPNSYSYINSFETSIINIKKFFPEAHIILVFRKHGDFLVSLYKQYVQEGGVLPFHKFYNEKGVIKDEDLDFSRRISHILNNFQNFSFLSFEDFKIEGVEYFNRFFATIGIGPGENSKRKANRSISGSKIELLRIINQYYPRLPEPVQTLLLKNQMTPRKILQTRLGCWNPKDPEIYSEIKRSINVHFSHDWKNVETYLLKKRSSPA